MKKRNLLLPLFLGFALFLSACSSDTNQTAAANNAAVGNKPADGFRRPDFGQPERPADIRGIVKSLVGNEVDILKLEMNRQNGQGTGTPSTTNNQEASPEKAPSLLGSATGSRQRGAGMLMGGPGGRPGEQSGSTREEMLARLKAMSTGEEKIIIPVGIKMLKPISNESGKREMVEATLADITADKSLMIWLNQSISDKKVAEFVLIN